MTPRHPPRALRGLTTPTRRRRERRAGCGWRVPRRCAGVVATRAIALSNDPRAGAASRPGRLKKGSTFVEIVPLPSTFACLPTAGLSQNDGRPARRRRPRGQNRPRAARAGALARGRGTLGECRGPRPAAPGGGSRSIGCLEVRTPGGSQRESHSARGGADGA
jgi:hypothetical protein